jgi:MFS family permease
MQRCAREADSYECHLYLDLPGQIRPNILFKSSCRPSRLRWYSPGMRKIGTFILFALLPLSSLLAQPHSTPNSAAASAETITLGNSAATLPGPWKFAPGDSPWQNGSPAWAQPGFDDGSWAKLDLAPKSGSVDLAYGTSGFVPGWTARGYPNLDGYAWYRLRIHVTDPGQPLWLKMPIDLDDAYQVYANGRYVGQFGRFFANHVDLYFTQPLSFPLPPVGPDGNLDLAVRFYMSAGTRFGTTPDVGGMHQPPVLGMASTVHLLQATDDDANLHSVLGAIARALLFLLLAPLALWIWLQNRQERAYLWLFVVLLCYVVSGAVTMLSAFSLLLTAAALTFWQSLLNALTVPLCIMFWWHWFGLRRQRWIPLAGWLFAAAGMLTGLGANLPLFGLGNPSLSWLHASYIASLWCQGALGLLLIIILIEGFRRDRTEALLAALPILLIEFTSFSSYLTNVFAIPSTFFPFGIGISVGVIASTLMVTVIVALVLRRFLHTQVRQELSRQAVALDMEQAKVLQQRVLVPEVMHSPVFSVESEYHPAQTVGGDFFQTLSKPDGSLLVVVGDVSGKGMSAAMLVAVLVGAIRTRADESFDPAAMLTMLNQRLIGRSGGHLATCLVAELRPDGTMHVANAGHLPPYLNGQELDLEGSLPLGAADLIDPSSRIITLEPGDRLTFLTDGVVEAMNSQNELFGFDRARTISNQPAAAIVEQAQAFGQNDDITVLSIEFTGAPSEAPEEALVTA